jgi:hypothetical protein
MDALTLAAWWSSRQGLDGSLAGASPARVLERSGWARSVAGVGPYFTLFSRAGIGRAAADAALAALALHELPSARGCTYVLPAADFALGLAVGQPFGGAELKVAARLGVTAKEIDRLKVAIAKALASGPLDPDGLREAVGGAARSLGEEGKKKGLNSTLPVALGALQSEGEIRRIPTNGRLDQQRYRYALWRPNPLAGFRLSPEEAQVELARRFFAWIGPATAGEFQAFAGLGVKAARAALAPLGLVEIPGTGGRLLPPAEREALAAYRRPKEPSYVVTSGLDAHLLLRRDLGSLLDPADAGRKVLADSGPCTLGSLADLPDHAILDRGRLVGLWEYDPEAGEIVWSSFVGRPRALVEAVRRAEAFVRDELGDARSFSLDSPKSRAPRIAALRRSG